MNWNSSWPSDKSATVTVQDDQVTSITHNAPKPEDAALGAKTDIVHANNPVWTAMTEDQLLMEWQRKKDAIEFAKAEEMDLRKYIVARAFPKKEEGTNTKDLGNGYQLKANIKFNYKLADNDTVEKTLDKIATIGNSGAFIAERLVSWKPSFLLTEYRQLQEDSDKGSIEAKSILKTITEMLTIDDAAPEL